MIVAAFVGSLTIGFYFTQRPSREVAKAPSKNNPADIQKLYASSKSCRDCHAKEFGLFEGSHHALAERAVDAKNDLHFFQNQKVIVHGTQRSEVRATSGNFELLSLNKTFPLERVIGVDPLVQFLTASTNGRFQVTELAADPHKGDWFDIFGSEDRRPGEWGHWTGRGMNWNNMCAVCHNTALTKNYDAASDSYATKMVEAGVGCEACHGPMADHVAWQRKNQYAQKQKDPTLKPLTRDQNFDTCGSCHSRRGELTDFFPPGEKFFDHYSLTIPDETDIFYADGQIRDEDYEFTSFLGSKMHAAGVRCFDCHDAHSGKTKLIGNALCMQCHGAPIAPAPKIEIAEHTHHKPGESGGRCVDCHMAQTTYMQRHSRHDHGFIIPDPLLTKKTGIPNACDRCHADRGLDWSIAAVEKWYGEKMNRFTRQRAEVIAAAKNESATSEKLLSLLQDEKHSFWRAVELGLLKRWCAEPRVMTTLLANIESTNDLVRVTSVRSLEPIAMQPGVQRSLRELLDDPARAVRIEAAWALHATIETNSPAGQDLMTFLQHNCDQPAGMLQLGSFYFDRGENENALGCFQRAVQWDPNSAPFHNALAVAWSVMGKKSEAVEEMKAACRLAPQDAEYRFKLGLALSDTGEVHDAVAALEETVKLDPRFAQAWYNLGLGYSALNEPAVALEKIQMAESLNSESAQYPYARATILAKMGRTQEASVAAKRALEIQPGFEEALVLLRSVERY
jgi:tetratricopeptide (TPR) repeat protein